MAETQRITGGYMEDWDSNNEWLNGGGAVTIDTGIDIPLGRDATVEASLVDVILVVDDILGSPIPTVPVVTINALGQVRVTFGNSAAAGNQFKWTCRVDYRHSATR
jgi:hypothetical protein